MDGSTILFAGVLSLAPLAFVALTSFAKISIVLGLVRNALGVPEVPSGAIVTALSLVLSLFVMAPVGDATVDALAPYSGRLDPAQPLADVALVVEVYDRASEPLRGFLERNSEAVTRTAFLDLARESHGGTTSLAARDFRVLAPAFLVRELTLAFRLGFFLFVPFLVLDLVVANLLVALGLTSLPAPQVALPFKLLLFAVANGWWLVVRALVLGYA